VFAISSASPHRRRRPRPAFRHPTDHAVPRSRRFMAAIHRIPVHSPSRKRGPGPVPPTPRALLGWRRVGEGAGSRCGWTCEQGIEPMMIERPSKKAPLRRHPPSPPNRCHAPDEANETHPVAISGNWTAESHDLLRSACKRLIDNAKHVNNTLQQKSLVVQPIDIISSMSFDKRLRHALTSRNAISHLSILLEPRLRDRSSSKAAIRHYVLIDIPSRLSLSAVNTAMNDIDARSLWCRRTSFGRTAKFRLSRRSLRHLIALMDAPGVLSAVRIRLHVAILSCRHRAVQVPWLGEYGSSLFRGSVCFRIYRVA